MLLENNFYILKYILIVFGEISESIVPVPPRDFC